MLSLPWRHRDLCGKYMADYESVRPNCLAGKTVAVCGAIPWVGFGDGARIDFGESAVPRAAIAAIVKRYGGRLARAGRRVPGYDTSGLWTTSRVIVGPDASKQQLHAAVSIVGKHGIDTGWFEFLDWLETLPTQHGPTPAPPRAAGTGRHNLKKRAERPRQRRGCLRCSTADAGLRCTGCRRAWYCNRQCQYEHLPVHQGQCSLRIVEIQNVITQPELNGRRAVVVDVLRSADVIALDVEIAANRRAHREANDSWRSCQKSLDLQAEQKARQQVSAASRRGTRSRRAPRARQTPSSRLPPVKTTAAAAAAAAAFGGAVHPRHPLPRANSVLGSYSHAIPFFAVCRNPLDQAGMGDLGGGGGCARPGCQRRAVTGARCSRCKLVHYCSPECQRQHWHQPNGHRHWCQAPQKASKLRTLIDAKRALMTTLEAEMVSLQHDLSDKLRMGVECDDGVERSFKDSCLKDIVPEADDGAEAGGPIEPDEPPGEPEEPPGEPDEPPGQPEEPPGEPGDPAVGEPHGEPEDHAGGPGKPPAGYGEVWDPSSCGLGIGGLPIPHGPVVPSVLQRTAEGVVVLATPSAAEDDGLCDWDMDVVEEGCGVKYADWLWRQDVRVVELRIMLPPAVAAPPGGNRCASPAGEGAAKHPGAGADASGGVPRGGRRPGHEDIRVDLQNRHLTVRIGNGPALVDHELREKIYLDYDGDSLWTVEDGMAPSALGGGRGGIFHRFLAWYHCHAPAWV